MPNKSSQLNIDNFPSELKKQIKIICAKKEVSIKDYVIQTLTREAALQNKK